MKMTEEILNIIHAVLDYKKLICSQNRLNQFYVDNFDWFAETEKYYRSLDLPEGMKHHRSYLESILSYQTRGGMEKLDKMDNTESEDLCNFEF